MYQLLLTPFLLAALAAAKPLNRVELSEREICPVTTNKNAQLIGDGNPHQNFVFKQVSGTTDCTGNPSGSASITDSQSVTWTVSVGFTSDFITGGFSVSESVSTGSTNAFGCTTGSGTIQGDLCVFERIQTTAYTVNLHTCTTSCGGTSCGDTGSWVMTSPNSNQGGCFYDNVQLGLPCNGLGSEHVVANGPAGGPQSISCEPSLVS